MRGNMPDTDTGSRPGCYFEYRECGEHSRTSGHNVPDAKTGETPPALLKVIYHIRRRKSRKK